MPKGRTGEGDRVKRLIIYCELILHVHTVKCYPFYHLHMHTV